MAICIHTDLMIIHSIIIFARQTRSMLLILIKHLVFQKLSLQISCRVLRYAGCVSIIYKARRARTTPLQYKFLLAILHLVNLLTFALSGERMRSAMSLSENVPNFWVHA